MPGTDLCTLQMLLNPYTYPGRITEPISQQGKLSSERFQGLYMVHHGPPQAV